MSDATVHEEIDPETVDFAGTVPGEPDEEFSSVSDGIKGYLIGLVLAALLTATSFLILTTDLLWGPGIGVGLLVLAVAQMGVHLVFFLHITTGPDNTNNIMALAFGVFIVVLVIAGSLWIMYNLNQNMMPADMQDMQGSGAF